MINCFFPPSESESLPPEEHVEVNSKNYLKGEVTVILSSYDAVNIILIFY